MLSQSCVTTLTGIVWSNIPRSDLRHIISIGTAECPWVYNHPDPISVPNPMINQFCLVSKVTTLGRFEGIEGPRLEINYCVLDCWRINNVQLKSLYSCY